MSEKSESGKEADMKTKLQIAKIGALGTLAAAVISAIVSWYVSTSTLEVEAQRVATEDTVKRASIFKDLMTEVGTGGNAGYAILALWKLYEQDRKLVIITALQSEDPQAISVLRLLGLEKELDKYKRTIRHVVDNVGSDRRREMLRLYADIDPDGLLDLSFEKFLREQTDTFTATDSFTELTELIDARPQLQERLTKISTDDPRITSSLPNRFGIALSLYLVGETTPFDRLIQDATEHTGEFGQLATLIKASFRVAHYEVRDLERLLDLSIVSMSEASEQEYGQGRFFNWLEVFDLVSKNIKVSEGQKPSVLKMLKDHFRKFPEQRLTRERIIRSVVRMDKDSAKVLFYSAISCEDEHQSKRYFHVSDAPALLFDSNELEELDDFAALRLDGVKKLQSLGSSCEVWETL